MRVGLYLRVSTRGQGEDDRLGLGTQQAKAEAYCAEHGHQIVERYVDKGFSGATADRPGLATLLADAANEVFDAVLVYKWDRLARAVTLDGYLRYTLARSHVAVLSATESNGVDPTAKLTEQILASVAEYERHLIVQRLANARKLKAAKGGYAHGQPPYGYRADSGKLVPIPEEQEVLSLIQELRRQGTILRDIVSALNDGHIRARSGNAWQISTVSSILRRHQ